MFEGNQESFCSQRSPVWCWGPRSRACSAGRRGPTPRPARPAARQQDGAPRPAGGKEGQEKEEFNERGE